MRNKTVIKRKNARDALKEYVSKCSPYTAAIPDVYKHLSQAEASEIVVALEHIVGIVSQYRPALSATAELLLPEQDVVADIRVLREGNLAALAGTPSLTRGQKATRTHMSPAEKVVYARRLKKENAKVGVQAKTTSSEAIPSYSRRKAQVIRHRLGYSRTELARILKISSSYITAFERGELEVSRNPSGKKMKRYLQWYRANINA